MQSPSFQQTTPSVQIERKYHQLVEDECGGDYENYECLQKVYIKTMKDGTFDRADAICMDKRGDEDEYYACLDSVYGDDRWADRFAGIERCALYDGRTGYPVLDPVTKNVTCLEMPPRPLSDRRPMQAVPHHQ